MIDKAEVVSVVQSESKKPILIIVHPPSLGAIDEKLNEKCYEAMCKDVYNLDKLLDQTRCRF